MQDFETSYLSLNDEQKRAVDYVDGPLLVLAGPGTGKTQLLSLRAAQILRKTDATASNIICLTYTNKAAVNMKERLLALIGPEANGITVKTFHSFAGDIISKYPDYFWNGANLRPIPDTRQLELIENILSDLPISHPLALKFAGQFTLVGTVIKAISVTKEAGLTPDKLRDILKLNLAYINEIEPELVAILDARLSEKKYPELIDKINALKSMGIKDTIAPILPLDEVIKDGFHRSINEQLAGKKGAVSKWKSKWIQSVDGVKGMHRERKYNDWWLHLCEIYETYQEKSQAMGYYDTSDMILEVIGAAESNPDLRADIQEQYTHVMIDEFQDTNLAQGRLSHLVAEHYSSEGKPNIMAVGDDDQTIYRFQGAELNNMRSFIDLYGAEVIVLSNNYRSSQSILDLSKKVIEKSEYRLVTMIDGLEKNLKAVKNSESSVEFKSYATSAQQYSGVVDRVAELSREGSVAVLARKHESLKNLMPFFNGKNISVSYEHQENLFDNDIVKLIMKISGLVTALHDGDVPNANYLTAEIIRHEAWGVGPEELWKMAIQNRKSEAWFDALLKHSDKSIANIGHWLLWLSTIADAEPATISMEYIIGLSPGEHLTSPIYEYLKTSKNTLRALSAVNKLRSLMYEYGGQNTTLKDFYLMTKRLEDNNKIINDNSSYIPKDSNIELLTVHKAKGLEYDSVIIVDAIENLWSPSRNNSNRTPPSNLPLKQNGDDMDDYARLLYVAATRARNNLFITSYKIDDNSDPVQATTLLDGVLNPEPIEMGDSNEQAEQLTSSLLWPRLTPKDEMGMLRPYLGEYKISATHLTSFLNVEMGGPQNFFERYMLKIPTAHSDKLAFGRAMHSALEFAQHSKNKGTFEIGSTITTFEDFLKNEPMTKESFNRYLVHGTDVIKRLFKEIGFNLEDGAIPEQKIEATINKEIRLTGKLDVLHKTGNTLYFDDYKTGKSVSYLDSESKSAGVKAWRNRFQIIFYYVLIKNSASYKDFAVDKARLIYVESESYKEMVKEYSPKIEDIELVEQLIPIIWRHVQDLNFPNTSHYEASYNGIKQFIADLIEGRI